MFSVDERAKRVLYSIYWDRDHWRSPLGVPEPEDLEYACRAGYVIDPLNGPHDDVVARLLAAESAVPMRDAADAFVARLSTRQLAVRGAQCAIGPKAFDRDLSKSNFARFKWGASAANDSIFALVSLEKFAEEGGLIPSEQDRRLYAKSSTVSTRFPPGLPR